MKVSPRPSFTASHELPPSVDLNKPSLPEPAKTVRSVSKAGESAVSRTLLSASPSAAPAVSAVPGYVRAAYVGAGEQPEPSRSRDRGQMRHVAVRESPAGLTPRLAAIRRAKHALRARSCEYGTVGPKAWRHHQGGHVAFEYPCVDLAPGLAAVGGLQDARVLGAGKHGPVRGKVGRHCQHEDSPGRFRSDIHTGHGGGCRFRARAARRQERRDDGGCHADRCHPYHSSSWMY